MILCKTYADFLTTTCLEWKPVLRDDGYKEVIIESMRFLVREKRVFIYAFVIMENHFHLIWQMRGDNERADVQRDFLKYTAQQILIRLRNKKSELLDELLVNAKDRKYQLWKRNSLSVPIWSPGVVDQKLDYIHLNPVRAGICTNPEDYKYSSARFYICGDGNWDFLSHCDG